MIWDAQESDGALKSAYLIAGLPDWAMLAVVKNRGTGEMIVSISGCAPKLGKSLYGAGANVAEARAKFFEAWKTALEEVHAEAEGAK